MSAVFLLEGSWGQGKRNKGKEWYPTHPRPTVATLPHTLPPRPCPPCLPPLKHTDTHSHTPPGNRRCSLCNVCHKTSLYFITTSVFSGCVGGGGGGIVHLPVESICPGRLASHLPCLLIGLGIYCNAIVFDGIGPVLTLMMPSSLNF